MHGGVTLLTSTAYDAASRIASVTYPSGAKAAYARDAMGRITGVTLAPRTRRRANGGFRHRLPAVRTGYSASLSAMALAASRAFDLDYRLTHLAEGGIQNLTYGYDAADNVLTIADGVHSGNSQTFGYDTLDRLTSAWGRMALCAYTYDAVGNRLTQQAGSTGTTYTYTPQSNRLTQIRTGSALQVLSYTPAGNITTFANVAASVASTRPTLGIGYNQDNRLARVLSGGQQTMTYTYDAFGQRLVKTGRQREQRCFSTSRLATCWNRRTARAMRRWTTSIWATGLSPRSSRAMASCTSCTTTVWGRRNRRRTAARPLSGAQLRSVRQHVNGPRGRRSGPAPAGAGVRDRDRVES